MTPNFFEVAGLAPLNGRTFTLADHEGAARAAIVNATLARLLWPDRSAIGECLYVGRDAADCAAVVGVVESPQEFGLANVDGMPQYYLPLAQALSQDATSQIAATRRTLVVRTAGDPGRAVPGTLAALADLFPDLPRDRVRSLPEVFAPQIRSWKIGTGLFGAAALLALVLAAIGLYAAIAFGVRQREAEFGIRLALGAQAADVRRLVLAQGFGLAALGIMAGALAALWAGRFVAPLLFQERSPHDPIAFGAAALVLLAVALTASLLPARRAARVDPRQALQAE